MGERPLGALHLYGNQLSYRCTYKPEGYANIYYSKEVLFIDGLVSEKDWQKHIICIKMSDTEIVKATDDKGT